MRSSRGLTLNEGSALEMVRRSVSPTVRRVIFATGLTLALSGAVLCQDKVKPPAQESAPMMAASSGATPSQAPASIAPIVNVSYAASSLSKSQADALPIGLQIVEEISRFILGLAWPLVLLILLIIYRAPLTRLIDRIKSLTWGDKGAQFADEVQALEDKADVEPAPAVAAAVALSTSSMARADPRGAILNAWLDVEAALVSLVQAQDLGAGYTRLHQRPLTAFRLVQQQKILTPKYESLFHDLRALRNEAAHAPQFTPPPDSVIRYAELAKELADELRRKAQSPS